MLDDGLNLNVLDETTQGEIDTYLGVMRRTHAPLYEMTANALWLDSRPDFVKLHRRGARIFGRVDGVLDPVRGPLTGLALLFDYILMGWDPDVDAFKCGLDIATLDLTDADRANLFGWYERTIGYVPRSVQFANTYNAAFLKAYRLKWENAFKGALPKQMMPLLMLRN